MYSHVSSASVSNPAALVTNGLNVNLRLARASRGRSYKCQQPHCCWRPGTAEDPQQTTIHAYEAVTPDCSIIGPRRPISPYTHAQQQQPHKAPSRPPRHNSSRITSLARALHLQPAQLRAMTREYPSLVRYNHAQLADKLSEMAGVLQLQPQQLSAVLVAKPKVLGCSLGEFESRVRELQRLLGPLDVVSQLVLQEPRLLSWSASHLSRRIKDMAACLSIQQEQLLLLLQQHPQLLPASSNWVRCLQLLQQLMQMSASIQESGVGVVQKADGKQQQQQGAGLKQEKQRQQQQQQWQERSSADVLQQQQQEQEQQIVQQMVAVGQQLQQLMQQRVPPDPFLKQQQLALIRQLQQSLHHLQLQLRHLQQQGVAENQQQQQQQLVPMSAAQQLMLKHPQLLLLPPEQMLASIAAMQAQSGLSVAEVAAVVVANPTLLLTQHTMVDKELQTLNRGRENAQTGKKKYHRRLQQQVDQQEEGQQQRQRGRRQQQRTKQLHSQHRSMQPSTKQQHPGWSRQIGNGRQQQQGH